MNNTNTFSTNIQIYAMKNRSERRELTKTLYFCRCYVKACKMILHTNDILPFTQQPTVNNWNTSGSLQMKARLVKPGKHDLSCRSNVFTPVSPVSKTEILSGKYPVKSYRTPDTTGQRNFTGYWIRYIPLQYKIYTIYYKYILNIYFGFAGWDVNCLNQQILYPSRRKCAVQCRSRQLCTANRTALQVCFAGVLSGTIYVIQ